MSRVLTAKEGSCVKIECRVQNTVVVDGAKWFWMKDASWDAKEEKYVNGTYFHSTATDRPVSKDIEKRVSYVGSEPSGWNNGQSSARRCSILICDLKKTDSGDYVFRFLGSKKWATEAVNLTVTGQYEDLNTKRSF